MQKLFSLFVLLCIFVSHDSFAAEIDSVTPRKLNLDNSLNSINTIFNQRMQEGIQKANAKQGDIENIGKNEFCDEEILYTELRKAIFQSFTASWGLKGYDLDKQLRILLARQSYSLSLNDSIYRDINYLEGLSLNIKELSDVVNINDHPFSNFIRNTFIYNDKAMSIDGIRFTGVFVKSDEGGWRLVQGHLSRPTTIHVD